MKKQSKTQQNNEFIRKMIDDGREYILKSELPHPNLQFGRMSNLLARNGNIYYLRSSHA